MILSQLFKKWKYYSLRDLLSLGYAVTLQRLSGRTSRELLLKNAVFSTLLDRQGTIVKNGKTWDIGFEGGRYTLRAEGSDLAVFNQIILHEELHTVVTFAKKIARPGLVIMDCGANIGLSTLYFKKAFPDATVICVEPEAGNYKLLCGNIENNKLTNVVAVQKGVWFEKGVLYPNTNFRDGQEWSFSLQEQVQGGAAVDVDVIENLIMPAGVTSVDVLKIDIEGAEHKLFDHLEQWVGTLQQVKIVSVEVHEEIAPAWGIEEKLLAAGFRIRRSGELIIGIRPEYV